MDGKGFTSARFCPVERFRSGLHAHGALATISAPCRSGPRFPHYMCQWARHLTRVKLNVICGARFTFRWWSCSHCERCCESIHCVCKCIRRFNLDVQGKTVFVSPTLQTKQDSRDGYSNQTPRRNRAELHTSSAKRAETWRGGVKGWEPAIGLAVALRGEREKGKDD